MLPLLGTEITSSDMVCWGGVLVGCACVAASFGNAVAFDSVSLVQRAHVQALEADGLLRSLAAEAHLKTFAQMFLDNPLFMKNRSQFFERLVQLRRLVEHVDLDAARDDPTTTIGPSDPRGVTRAEEPDHGLVSKSFFCAKDVLFPLADMCIKIWEEAREVQSNPEKGLWGESFQS